MSELSQGQLFDLPMPTDVTVLEGPMGRARLHVYIGSPNDPEAVFHKWVIELPYLRYLRRGEEDGEAGHTGFLSGFVFPLDLLRGANHNPQHERPSRRGKAYYVSVAEIWGEAVTIHDPDSWEDYDDTGMELPGQDMSVANAHLRLVVEKLLAGEFHAEEYDEPVPAGSASWDAYWDNLYEQAARSMA